MTFHKPKAWSKWLGLAQYWYNTSYHTSIKMSPFKALYGTDLSFHQLNPVEPPVAAVEDMLLERKEMNLFLQNQLAAKRNKMKQWADKKRTDREFQVFDLVYLRLQLYRQKPWDIEVL